MTGGSEQMSAKGQLASETIPARAHLSMAQVIGVIYSRELFKSTSIFIATLRIILTMGRHCSAGNCSNNQSKTPDLKFFRFPLHRRQPERRRSWALACHRMDPTTGQSWEPKNHVTAVYICAEHFTSGRPVDAYDHPDYVPSVFSGHLTGTPNNDRAKAKVMTRFNSLLKRRAKSQTGPETPMKKPCVDHLIHSENYGSDEEEFGIIRPSIIKCLKSILQQYPENGQILKEIIQNAEDAGAKKVRFLVDWNTYGQDETRLEHPGLQQFQGPALYSHNDARFTVHDWKGLQLLQDSLKEKDPMKIGRFGLGFKSIYHLTDLPSVLSGCYLGYFDPSERFFQNKYGEASTGKRYMFTKSPDVIQNLRHQFEPYDGKYGCSLDQLHVNGYDGTLFRFPLRQKATQLSESVHTEKSMELLYDSFISDAASSLLFLHNVEDIELWWLSKGQSEPQLYYKVVAASDDRAKAISNGRTRTLQPGFQSVAFPLKITVQCSGRSETTHWLVSEVLGSASLLEKCKHQAIPVVGVAMPTSVKEAGCSSLKGQLFCYVPLSSPEDGSEVTGLPVHVNGTFSLSPDRHHIITPSAGQSWNTNADLVWNYVLRSQLLPKAYRNLIMEAVRLHSEGMAGLDVATIMLAWPDQNKVHSEWKQMALHVMKQLSTEYEVFHSDHKGGSWVGVSSAVIEDLSCDEIVQETLKKVALRCDLKVIHAPDHVHQFLLTEMAVKQLSPALLAAGLQRCPQECSGLTQTEKYMLLEYLLRDESIHLQGLPLLPTADDGFTEFSLLPEQLVYSESATHQGSLLPGQEDILLAQNLPSPLHQRLVNLAKLGKYQLRELNPTAVVEHLPNSIPSAWNQITGSGLKLPKSDPNVTWLHRVWQYLSTHFHEELSCLRGLPLLLDEVDNANVMIYRMNMPSFLLYRQSKKLDSSVEKILKLFGFKLLVNIPKYVSCLTKQFVCPSQPVSVIDVLSQSFTITELISLLDSAESNLKVAFQQFLSSCTTFSPNQVNVLVQLPMFQVEGCRDRFVCISEVGEACLSKPAIPLPVPLLDLSVKCTKQLARYLGASLLPAGKFLHKYVFNRISSMTDDEVRVMVAFMNAHWQSLKTEDEQLVKTLMYQPFVTTDTSRRACPVDLFNPSIPLIAQLFAGQDLFPPSWMRTSYLNFLEELGLKGVIHVSSADLVEAAKAIDRFTLAGGSVGVKEKKATAILEILTQMPALMDPELLNITWLPELSRPQSYPLSLHWKGQDEWAKPCEVANKSTLSLTGSVLSVSKLTLPNFVGFHLGSNAVRDVSIITSHLKHIIERYSSTEKHLYLPMVVCIYKSLARYNSSDVRCSLNKVRWVWHGDGFAFPDEIVVKPSKIELMPYMFVLPDELRPMQELFVESGAPEECGVQQLVNILGRIGKKWVEHNSQELAQDKDLVIVQQIIEQLSQYMDEITEEMRLEIPIPTMQQDDGVRMFPLKDTTCAARAAIYQSEASDVDHFVHPCIPLQTALRLGIRRLESRIIGAEGLEFIQFGQSESLVNRLRNILSEYQDGFSILKELVQNADDAKATVVKVLWDERKNQEWMTHLLDPGMAQCQGPALWAYNDAFFNEQDYRNIISLGAGNKRSEMNKIGKFGLGFNSVYNLTDVPGFISQGDIVIFDPHLTHLGEHLVSSDKPGVRIDFSANSRLFRVHKDQFQPFQGVFNCDIMNNHCFEGTLFRFPLRTRAAARTSEISKMVYDRVHMIQLLKMLVENAEDLLLFTQSVWKIELHHLPENARGTQDMTKVLEVTKETVKILSSEGIDSEGQRILDVAAHNFHRCSPPQELKMTEIISIKKQLGSQNRLDLTDCLPLAQDYLISHWLGENESRVSANNVSQMGLTPLASVAMPVSFDGDSLMPSVLASLGREAKVFCYLPLPLPSGLPVHINGSFSVHPDRRRISERSNECSSNTEAEWNEALLMDAVAEAYIQLLQILDKYCQQTETEVVYCDYWPNVKNATLSVMPLVTALYKKIAANASMPVVHRTQTMTIKDVQFVVCEEIDSHCGKHEIHQALSLCCTTSVCVPAAIIQTFERADSGLASSKVLDIQHIFTQIIFANLERLPSLLRDELTVHAMKMEDEEINAKIMETNCIPVDQEETTLKRPSELVNPKSEAGALYVPNDLRFPAHPFCIPKHLSFLVELGLLERLSWADLLERADSMKKLNDQDHDNAVRRCSKLLMFMEDESILPQEICERLMSIEFLPVVPKPEDHPLPWKWESNEGVPILVSAENAYLSDYINLVSASYGIISTTFLPPLMKSRLGLVEKQIILSDVMHQLFTLMESPITKETGGVALDIYRNLGELCCNGQDTEQLSADMQKWLDGKAFIFIEKAFYQPVNVSGPQLMHDCPPYLCRLPVAYTEKKVKDFLHCMGYRDEVDIKHVVHSLQSLEYEKSGEKLSENELKLVIPLLEILSDEMKNKRVSFSDVESVHGNIFVPDWGGKLQASSSLCFMDVQFLSEDLDQLGLPLTHEELSPKLAMILGVRTQKDLFLESQCEALPFGQKEELVTRLKHIVDSYPFDIGVLREFIQNADDAGASEIHLILDTRTHKSDKVFSEEWEVLQGPALLIYNDKPFTKEDLKGIQNLGVGTKDTDPAKTGQYGIGFNAIYHLTDVPSFITHSQDLDRICIFDPHCKYLESSVRDAPGGQFFMEKLVKIFPDVFDTFLPEHIPVRNATLFRFPLRKRSSMSQIKREETTCEDIEKLFETLRSEAMENLLFLSHLKMIKLSKIGETGKLQQLYECSTTLTQEDEKKRLAFVKKLKCSLDALMEKVIDLDSLKLSQVSYQLNIRNSDMLVQEWLVTQQIGFSEFIDETSLIREAFETGKFSLSPRGGTAVCLRQRWENDGRDLESLDGKIYCMFPTHEETNVPVHINGHFALMFENRRELWKNLACPEKDYKRAWNELLFSQIVAPCYVTMLDFLKGALVQDLGCDRQMRCSCDYETLKKAIDGYYTKWPVGGDTMNSLTKSVYEIIAAQERSLLPKVRHLPSAVQNQESESLGVKETGITGDNQKQNWQITWVAVGEGAHVMFYLPENSGTGDQCDLEQLLSDVGLDLLFLTEAGKKRIEPLQQVTDKLKEVTLSIVRTFLRGDDEGGQCQLNAVLPAPIQSTSIQSIDRLNILIDYCFSGDFTVDDAIGLPLLLTFDEYLCVFGADHRKICSDHYCLFPNMASRFVHPRFIEKFSHSTSDDLLRNLTIDVLAELLHQTLPAEATSQQVLEPSQMKWPPATWLIQVWKVIDEIVKEAGPEDILQFLLPLWDFSLLYGRRECVMNLFPICHARQLIGNEAARDGVLQPISQHLTHVCFPEEEHGVETIHKIVALPTTPEAVLKILHAYLIETKCQVKEAHVEDILSYVTNHLDIWKNNLDCRRLLRELPIYKSKHGDRAAFMAATYAVPSIVPWNGIDIWGKSHGMLFLDAASKLKDLFEFLGCKFLTVREFYIDFIFRHLECFDYNQRMTHLYFIYKQWKIEKFESVESQNSVTNLVHKLKSVPFVTVNAQLLCADQFGDPDNRVYSKIDPNKLPPRLSDHASVIFYDHQWHEFLRLCGMRSECGAAELSQYARQIEQSGINGGTEAHMSSAKNAFEPSTKVKADTLTNYIYKQWKEKKLFHVQLHSFSNIRFICPSKVVDKVRIFHNPVTDVGNKRDRYVSFNESYDKSYCALVWTQAPVIDYQRLTESGKKAEEFQSAVSMKTEPSVEIVLSHLQVLSQSWKENLSDSDLSEVPNIFTDIFTYLKNKESELTSTQIDMLSKLACIPVVDGRRLVAPCLTVMNFTPEQELWPYLVRVPSIYGPLEEFLMKLGTTQSPSLKQYMNVLASLYNDCQNDGSGAALLSLDLRYLADKTMVALIKLLIECGDISGEEFPQLYLLSNSGCLYPVEKLVLNDSPGFHKRIIGGTFDFVRDARNGFHRTDLIKAFRKLPQIMQPKWLSKIVAEKVCRESKGSAIMNSISCELQERLHMPEFQDGIARLVGHFKFQNGETPVRTSIDAMVKKIGNVTVRSVTGLQTELVHKASGKPIDSSLSKREIFFEVLDGSCCIYLRGDRPLDAYQQIHVARVVKEMVGMALPGAETILPLLTCQPGEIADRLDEMNIFEEFDGEQSAKKKQLEDDLPDLGGIISAKYQMQLKPLEPGKALLPGEIVAVKVQQHGKPVLARIIQYCAPNGTDVQILTEYEISVKREDVLIFQ